MWIESSQELGKINFNNINIIGISAGASTPDRVIKEVAAKNERTGISSRHRILTLLRRWAKALVRIKPGQQIKGTVIFVDENEVGVNIGYKSDGFVSKENLTIAGDVDPREVVKEGDEIEVEVLKVNDGNGNVILSKRPFRSVCLRMRCLIRSTAASPSR